MGVTMSIKRIPPLDLKRTLLKLLVVDAIALILFVVGKLINNAIITEVGLGALGALMVWTVGLLIFGPLFLRKKTGHDNLIVENGKD
jgi:hypothetical protein